MMGKRSEAMRSSENGIGEAFLKRFSPRSFVDRPVDEADMRALIEAAGTAPSCFNEQPWVFVRGEREDFLAVLSEKNAERTKDAGAFLLVCSRTEFSRNGKPNRWHAYDSGTAMGYLILEALRRGIYVHPMGGYDIAEATKRFGLEGLETHAVLAVGYTDASHTMTPRRAIDEIILDRRKG
jgi:nitroreductase